MHELDVAAWLQIRCVYLSHALSSEHCPVDLCLCIAYLFVYAHNVQLSSVVYQLLSVCGDKSLLLPNTFVMMWFICVCACV
jgi:hypothetical protein